MLSYMVRKKISTIKGFILEGKKRFWKDFYNNLQNKIC